jgi:hypothetical protein
MEVTGADEEHPVFREGVEMREREKIIFRMEQDEDGYPPFRFEGVWATEERDNARKRVRESST